MMMVSGRVLGAVLLGRRRLVMLLLLLVVGVHVSALRRVVLLRSGVGPLLVAALEVVQGLGRVRHVSPLHVGGRVERPVVRPLDVVRVLVLGIVLLFGCTSSSSS